MREREFRFPLSMQQEELYHHFVSRRHYKDCHYFILITGWVGGRICRARTPPGVTGPSSSVEACSSLASSYVFLFIHPNFYVV